MDWCSEKNRDDFKEFQIQEQALIVMGEEKSGVNTIIDLVIC